MPCHDHRLCQDRRFVGISSVFDEIGIRDVATWNAMIAAYSNAGLNVEALNLFRLTMSTNVEPNRTTIAIVVLVAEVG